MTELTELLPYLFIGSSKAAWQAELLRQAGISHILNVMESARFLGDAEFVRVHLPLSDYGDGDLLSVARRAGTIIEEVRERDERLLLHCGRGQNRSPSVATAYLMLHHGLTLRAAMAHVRQRRPQFAPHEGYLRQLSELERELYGTSTLDESEEPLSIQAIIKRIKDEELGG